MTRAELPREQANQVQICNSDMEEKEEGDSPGIRDSRTGTWKAV